MATPPTILPGPSPSSNALSGAPVKFALHFAELDELYANAGTSPDKRLALLEQNHEIVVRRDDALSREIGLKVFAGKYDEAIRLMTGRKFAVWEGGSLDVADQWVNAHLGRGQQRLAEKKYADALTDLQAAQTIPDNLPNDRQAGNRGAELAYWTGAAYAGLGDNAQARQSWQKATDTSAPSRRRAPEGRLSERQVQSVFQALAKRKLGQDTEAETALREILTSAQRALTEETSGKAPGSQAALAHYVAGLCQLGLGQSAEARAQFERALEAKPDHLGAKACLRQLNQTH